MVLRAALRCNSRVMLHLTPACCLQDADESCNVIHMTEFFYFRNHLCISFELLNVNLYEFIKNNNFSPLSLALSSEPPEESCWLPVCLQSPASASHSSDHAA